MKSQTIIMMLFYAFGIYFAFAAAFFLFSDSVLYQPPRYAPYKQLLPNVKIPLSNGKVLSGVYLPNPKAEYTVLLSHGNAEDLGSLTPFLIHYHAQGYAVFAYDYEGYGESTGRPSEKNLYQDINATYDYLVKNLHVDPSKIVLHGRSLGSGPSIELARTKEVGKVILESPFVSAYQVFTRIPLPFDKYKNLSKIKQIKAPVLIIHGEVDTIIPFSHGNRMYKAVVGKKEYYWVKGASHNDIYYVAGKNYWIAINNFIRNT